MTRWVTWGALLFAVNVAGTLTSRARNTPSLGYHAVCAMLNHACWFGQTVIFVGLTMDLRSGTPLEMTFAFLYYSFWSTVGSIVAHWLSLNFLEKGNRRVGGYGKENAIR